MDQEIALIVVISITLIFAKLIDEYFTKKRFPVVLGEILAGILLGIIFGLISEDLLIVSNSEIYKFLSFLGITFLMFLSGLETDVNRIKRSLSLGFSVALIGSIAPFLMVYTSLFFLVGKEHVISIVYATIAIATSVGLTVRVLSDLNVLREDYSTIILSAAVIDDVIGIIAMGIAFGSKNMYILGLGLLAFIVIFILLYIWIIPYVFSIGEKSFRLSHTYISLAIAIMLIISVLSKNFGLSSVTGAYFAGLILGRIKERQIISNAIREISYSMFLPLFFLGIGYEIILDFKNLESYAESALYQVILNPIPYVFVTMAIVGKLLGAFFGAKLLGSDSKKSLIIGVGMIPRMEVALVIVSIAISSGMLNLFYGTTALYSTILLVLTSSIITPPILQRLILKEKGIEKQKTH